MSDDANQPKATQDSAADEAASRAESASRAGSATRPDENEVTGLAARASVGGVLMGLANLVPGISGGTMLVASGIYPAFIESIAELTTLKFKKRSLLVLAVVAGCALLSILLFAGSVKTLVVEHRWVMYSLFIGLTLGGVPVVWNMVSKPAERGVWVGAVLGFIPMAALAFAQSQGAGGDGDSAGFIMMFLAGVAGASAMILPGVSGGYLLLVMGVYVTILGAIDQVKESLKAGDTGALMTPILEVVLPVGLGVVVGVFAVSNALKWVLKSYEAPTLGLLLGLLVGAVFGIFPFQQGVAPEIGSTFKGRVVTAESLAEISPDKYPTEFFSPSMGQIAGALGLIVVGFALTALVAKLGHRKRSAKAAD